MVTIFISTLMLVNEKKVAKEKKEVKFFKVPQKKIKHLYYLIDKSEANETLSTKRELWEFIYRMIGKGAIVKNYRIITTSITAPEIEISNIKTGETTCQNN